MTSYTCPNCRNRIVTLADEYGDHPCNRCGWEPYEDEENEEEDEELYDWSEFYACENGCCSCCGCICGWDDDFEFDYEEEDE